MSLQHNVTWLAAAWSGVGGGLVGVAGGWSEAGGVLGRCGGIRRPSDPGRPGDISVGPGGYREAFAEREALTAVFAAKASH
jgi:hypothetical protein